MKTTGKYSMHHAGVKNMGNDAVLSSDFFTYIKITCRFVGTLLQGMNKQ
jgi:hypothetical protein